MKQKHFLLLAIAGFIAFISCEPETSQQEPKLFVYTTSISASYMASQSILSFKSNLPWEITVDAAWCTAELSQGQGNSDDKFITVALLVTANPTNQERVANITIKAGSSSASVKLTQTAGVPALAIVPSFITTTGADSYTIAIHSYLQWTATVVDAAANNWCTIEPSSGTGNGTITVSVAKNQSYARRHAFIVIDSYGVQQKGTILQNEGEVYSDPSIGVTIDGVTWATRNLANFGRFTDFSTDIGRYYQFDHATGYSYEGGHIERDGSHDDMVGGTTNPVIDFDWTYENHDWMLLNDPCPCGWRLPSAQELENLRIAGYHWDSALTGAWLGPDASSPTPDNAVFFPAGGVIGQNDVLHFAGEGCYWTGTDIPSNVVDGGYVLQFNPSTSNQVTYRFFDPHLALLVRCVKE